MKRILGILIVLLFALTMLTACQNDTSDAWEIVRGGWDFDVVRYEKGTENNRVAVFEKDGKCGLVDFEGNIIAPAEYTSLEIGLPTPDPSVTKLIGNTDTLAGVMFEPDGTKSEDFADGWGYEGFPLVYLHDNSIVVWNRMEGVLGSNYDAYKRYWYPQYGLLGTIALKPHPVVPVQKMIALPTEGSESEYPTLESELYALYNFETGELLTKFEFEAVINVGVIEDRIAVKKDGKWAYLNEKGEKVTEFIYDTAEVGTDGRWRELRMYAFSNGYAVVRQGDNFGLIDKQGNTVVEPTMQGVSQVRDDGLFFVKKDNKWWVARLK